ncbi:hypothetical protein BCR34DRAFT_96995 [Clohesyomyces aquaticus]|uniref:Uncharacterized protein n=1 Tax=Clohesyomyces aquaticus TaxID=1231657 RepID=A0A1Y2A2I5_9PLEO|nr:hypothetical protein BCR34DRAFT_96995 [Clohesyomyces aquaticus]
MASAPWLAHHNAPIQICSIHHQLVPLLLSHITTKHGVDVCLSPFAARDKEPGSNCPCAGFLDILLPLIVVCVFRFSEDCAKHLDRILIHQTTLFLPALDFSKSAIR